MKKMKRRAISSENISQLHADIDLELMNDLKIQPSPTSQFPAFRVKYLKNSV